MAIELAELEKWERDEALENLEGFKRGTRPAPTLYYTGTVKASQGDSPTVFVASDEEPDRHGDTISIAGWDLKAFQSNPVFLWMHGLDIGHLLPIGKVPKVWGEQKQLLAAVHWDDADVFAAEVHGKYQRGFLKAVSVGFRPLEFEELKPEKTVKGQFPSIKFLKQELLEISAVPVPANPRALSKALAMEHRRSYFPIPKKKEDSPKEPVSNPLDSIYEAVRKGKLALMGPGGK